MKIGELADQCGVSTKTIRYYESIGLVAVPHREANGYRRYDSGAVERLDFIRSAQSTGLTLTEIGSILELKDTGQRSCEHTRDLLARHLEDLDQQIDHLNRTKDQLQRMADRASALDPGSCTDPNRCQVIGSDPTA